MEYFCLTEAKAAWHKHTGLFFFESPLRLLLDLLRRMIDGSFCCCRGKYAKRLLSAHIKLHKHFVFFLVRFNRTEAFVVEFNAFLVYGTQMKKGSVGKGALARLADQLLFKN